MPATSLAQSQAPKDKSLAKSFRLQTIPYTPPSQEAKQPVSLAQPKLSPAAPPVRRGTPPGEVISGYRRYPVLEQ